LLPDPLRNAARVCDCSNGGADAWASAVKLMSRALLFSGKRFRLSFSH
jgi:hypothetical protein